MNNKILKKDILFTVLVILVTVNSTFSQQINIPRVDSMPNMPQPYIMRDWKRVAQGYDSLVFDENLSGQYLPLVFFRSTSENYPGHSSFGLHTAVGTVDPNSGECINVIPAVVGASLAGIDKTNQFGQNWALMCEEYFNKRTAENIYLNHPVTSSGNDWWYETMPNVFFLQLNSLYPHLGDFDYQVRTLADQWLTATGFMGGSTTPWALPNLNYRAWEMSTMTPLETGVKEPEAAGAIAWILYNAYMITGERDYLTGAEWNLEFLDAYTGNPSYELQLPYGVYTAARLNAELGTQYNIEKMINWCFDRGEIRGWGSIVGKWGDYDCSGLIGEANDQGHDYAFAMNGYEQAGALVPMVRYDDRFATAIAKWILNLANASRLFYPNYLPDDMQDNEDWAHTYDPNSYIGYESMKETKNGKSPYATGDAMDGGWASTNLMLYGSSHIGILGGIIDTTNIEAILCLDLLKTDYYRNDAYPSYLIYNPHTISKNVNIDVGSEMIDIYDAISNSVISESVTGLTQVPVGADEAVVIVLIPAGSAISQVGNKKVCNNIVIDYIPAVPEPEPMRIKALSAKDSVLLISDEGTTVYCTVEYSGPDNLSYTWYDNDIEIEGQAETLQWISPKTDGDHIIKCTVSDNHGTSLTDSVKIRLVGFINTLPVIEKITQDPSRIDPGDTARITCFAMDPDEEELTYTWSSQDGSFDSDNTSITTWNAPVAQGEYIIHCTVEDEHEGIVSDSLIVRVIDQSQYKRGNLIAHYPFNDDLNDYSGNNNHGTGHNVSFVMTRDGAYNFNGTDSYVEIPSSNILNCNEAITVTFWMKPNQLYDRETYPISHGLWHNRWKVSVSNNKVRWTIRTKDNESVIVTDLDSRTTIKKYGLYQVTGTYDGIYSDLYINSEFEGFLWQKGIIEDTDVAMTIGQAAPEDAANNFNGVLDEIRIYDYALSHDDIKEKYQQDLLAASIYPVKAPEADIRVLPNPFQQQTTISYRLITSSQVRVEILDYTGKRVKLLFSGRQANGIYSFDWDGTTDSGHDSGPGLYLCSIWIDNVIQTKKIVYN